MAVERGYEQQTAPHAGAAMPLTNAQAMGAGVGEAVSQIGGQVHQQQLRSYEAERKRQQDQELADWNHKFALHRSNMDGIVRQMRSTAGPGGTGHVEGIGKANEAARDVLFSGVKDEKVQRLAQQQWDEYSTRLSGNEGDFAEGQRVAKVAGDWSQATNLAAGRIRQGMDPASYAHELELGYANIDALQVDDGVKDKLRRGMEQDYGVAFVQHLQDSNPVGARAMLDSGAFDHLDPKVVEALRNGSDVEIRRKAAEEERVAGAAKAQFSDQLATVKTDAGNGIDIAARLPALAEYAATHGDASALAEIKGLERDSRFAKSFASATPLQRERRMAELGAIADNKRSEDQQAELAWLQKTQGGVSSQFNEDPVAWVMKVGRASEQPPALDQANPASFAARAQWARAMGKAYGRMNLFSKAERDAMQQRLAQGSGGYEEVMSQLALFGGRAARDAAREVAPGDHPLQQLVTLNAADRKIVLDGQAARQVNPKLLSTTQKDAIDRMRRGMDLAMPGLAGADKAGIYHVADNIAAYFLSKFPGDELNPDLYRASLNRALGATMGPSGWRGGLAGWNDQTFLVPDGMTAQEFTNGVFARVKADGKNGPVNPDGSPLWLGHARPVPVSPGIYQFMIGDKVVTDAKNKPWTYAVAGRK